MLFGCLSTPAALAVAWGINGFAQSPANPLLVNFVADIFPPEMRASVLGLWMTCQQVGGVVSNAFAALLMVQMGWKSVFTYGGLVVGVFSVLLVAVVNDPAERANNKTGSAAAKNETSAADRQISYFDGELQRACSSVPFKLSHLSLSFALCSAEAVGHRQCGDGLFVHEARALLPDVPARLFPG